MMQTSSIHAGKPQRLGQDIAFVMGSCLVDLSVALKP